MHATILLILSIIAYKQPQDVKQQIEHWMKTFDLTYIVGFLETFKEDPQKFLTFLIIIDIFYIIICLVYIYGALTCNNALMVVFILVELARLFILTNLVTVGLLILKNNTMDIGLLIGASVACSFVLLGLYYLWLCAANLPILINEMERDEHIATINMLQKLLESKNTSFQELGYEDDFYSRDMFSITRNKLNNPIRNSWNFLK
ncbi:unnamed protein product [Danaus chrysippus]|uniref:(African queen) hypothetical protein n=1 Tax=Danaus chrysippus TaxID=151541 RepID=A0A8J2RC06_9NEOP|nr:unnamed protein product [Danaus chrysippus]